MHRSTPHQPHHPDGDAPDQSEPGSLPVEPDRGPAPPPSPDDPDGGRSSESKV